MEWFKKIQQFVSGMFGGTKIEMTKPHVIEEPRSSYGEGRRRGYRGGGDRPNRGRNNRYSNPRGNSRYGNNRGGGPRPYGNREQGQAPGQTGSPTGEGQQDRGRQGGYGNRDRYSRNRGPRRWRERGPRRPEGESRPSNQAPRQEERLPKEERKFLVGTITHFFPNVSVAVLKVQKGAVQVNDLLAFEGEETKFRQKVASMQMDHKPVTLARVGQDVGIQVTERVREGDQVYRVDYVSAQRG